MRIAAHQPQYLPWLGYFDKMDRVDLFVVLDTVQYKKNEWQNRNRIRTAAGWQWLTVPVHYRFPMAIREVAIDDSGPWRRKHREALRVQHARALHVRAVLPPLEEMLAAPGGRLAELNLKSIQVLASLLGVTTPIVAASTLGALPEDADERLIALCRRFGASTYLAGDGGHAYMNLQAYRGAGIGVEFQAFRHPRYPQAHPGFEPNLSAVDVLMNRGPGAIRLARDLREAAA